MRWDCNPPQMQRGVSRESCISRFQQRGTGSTTGLVRTVSARLRYSGPDTRQALSMSFHGRALEVLAQLRDKLAEGSIGTSSRSLKG